MKTLLVALMTVVLNIAYSIGAAAAPTQPTEFSELKYSGLRPRLLVKATEKIAQTITANPDFILTFASIHYAPELGFTKAVVPYAKDQLFRVIYVERTDEMVRSTGIDQTYKTTDYKAVRLTLQPVDEALRPIGAAFELATKAKDDDKIEEFVGAPDIASNMPSLTYSHAGVDDLLFNVVDVKTTEGTILANSKARVVAVEKHAQAWSFAKDHTLIVRVTPCTPELARHECLAKLPSFGYLPDPAWGHLVAPKNRREFKIFGMVFR